MKYIVFGFFALLVTPVIAGTYLKKTASYETVNVSFYDADRKVSSFEVEVANSEEARSQGLMNRDSLDKDKGMLFLFPNEDMRYFWMQNTKIPLDIIYVNSKKRIVHIVENTEPYNLKLLSSKVPAKYAIEINAGLSKAQGIEKGQRMSIE